MSIRYGCFFSYAHGQHAYMSHFKDDLVEALKCYLEPHFDNETELFVDSEQLGGGDDIDRRLALAMCQSVTMIVICMAANSRPSTKPTPIPGANLPPCR